LSWVVKQDAVASELSDADHGSKTLKPCSLTWLTVACGDAANSIERMPTPAPQGERDQRVQEPSKLRI
jgi:hypothetical protein